MFDDILGHENVKRGLLHATLTQHLHHAFLFIGPEGIGKGMLAKAFVQSWLCEKTTPQHLERCLSCHNCTRIAQQIHPDVIEIIEESASIKIETIRDLQKKLSFPPFEAPHRYVIIHDVHKMQDAAANCLLKTLEEPEPHTTFILLTSQIQRLLPTIVSRCQVVRFAPFSFEDVAKFLMTQGESPEISEQIAALSGGSLSVALNLCHGDYKKDIIDTFDEILKTNSVLDAFSTAAALKGKKNMADHLLALIQSYLRDMLVLKTSPDSQIVLKSYRKQMTSRLPAISSQEIMRCIQLIQEINESFNGNLNELVVWERLMLGMHGVLF